MHGGGAERVAALLLNEFHRQGHHCEFLLTNDTQDKVVRNDLSADIPIIFLQDFESKCGAIDRLFYYLLRWYGSITCRLFELFKRSVPVHFAYCSFVSQYHEKIKALREYLKKRPNSTVITFLQPSIPMVMLAARGLTNKVIFSERGDARRLMQNRYGKKFIKKYYERADVVVFQTVDARDSYPENIADKGVIIVNPLTPHLPPPFTGERRKVINTFCRISKQKNLPLLLEAFKRVHDRHPDYQLHIIGDALNDEGEAVKANLKQYIVENHLESVVTFIPFSLSVHLDIISDSMYVNSSNYEGISNAMLEAMAIGLPTICTDCPISGAKAIIKDHENGLLVPIRDVNALTSAIIEMIENPYLAKKLSGNGIKLHEMLNVENIANRWLELLY